MLPNISCHTRPIPKRVVWVVAGLGILWQIALELQNWSPLLSIPIIPVIVFLAWTRHRSDERERSANLMADSYRRTLLHALLSAEEEERHKIAGELHDDTIQCMAATLLMLDVARSRAANTHTADAIEKAELVLRQSLERTRTLMFEMAPAVLNHHGLEPALKEVAEATARELGATMEFSCPPIRLEPAIEAMVFRVTREVLTNTRKHSQATKIGVSVKRARRSLVVIISDNGRGFDVEAMQERAMARTAHKHIGLASIVERVELAGGSAYVNSVPGQTKVLMKIPVTT